MWEHTDDAEDLGPRGATNTSDDAADAKKVVTRTPRPPVQDPVDAIPSLVKLRAKGTTKDLSELSPEEREKEKEEVRKRLKLIRFHASSCDFHLKGW